MTYLWLFVQIPHYTQLVRLVPVMQQNMMSVQLAESRHPRTPASLESLLIEMALCTNSQSVVTQSYIVYVPHLEHNASFVCQVY